MIMLTCLAMAKEEIFSIVSTYDLIPINSMIVQEYKNDYIVFIKDNYIHSIVIPKEKTEINFGNFPKLELKEILTSIFDYVETLECPLNFLIWTLLKLSFRSSREIFYYFVCDKG